MSLSGRTARHRNGWRSEILLAALVLSASVVSLQFIARALNDSAAGSFGQGIRDFAITLPVAALAAWIACGSRRGPARTGRDPARP